MSPQQMSAGARVGMIMIMAVVVVPVVFGGVGLVVMLAGRIVGLDLTPGVIIALAAVPTAYISWRLYQVAITEPDPYR